MSDFLDTVSRIPEYSPTDSDLFLAKVARNLRFYRVQQRWSQTQLAQKSGVPDSTISSLESGRRKPTLTTLYLLAKGLEVPLQVLLKE